MPDSGNPFATNLFGQARDDVANWDARLRALVARATASEARLTALEANLTAWGDWTPSLTADTVSPNLGATGTAEGRYKKVGKTVTGWGCFVFNGAGVAAGTGFYRLGLPFVAVARTAGIVNIGSGYIYDQSTGLTRTLDIQANPGITWGRGIFDGGGGVNIVDAAAPWVWAAGDQIHYSFNYETT